MFEAVKVANYVKSHNKELDQIMQDIFKHWNAIGKLAHDEKIQNKMQEIYLISVIRIWLTTAGIPKSDQKRILQELNNSLGE